MRSTRKLLALLLCLAVLLCLAPLAWAEDTAGYETRLYGKDVIVGFTESDSPLTVDTDYKYALIELEKEFPTSLTVYMGGTVFPALRAACSPSTMSTAQSRGTST